MALFCSHSSDSTSGRSGKAVDCMEVMAAEVACRCGSQYNAYSIYSVHVNNNSGSMPALRRSLCSQHFDNDCALDRVAQQWSCMDFPLPRVGLGGPVDSERRYVGGRGSRGLWSVVERCGGLERVLAVSESGAPAKPQQCPIAIHASRMSSKNSRPNQPPSDISIESRDVSRLQFDMRGSYQDGIFYHISRHCLSVLAATGIG